MNSATVPNWVMLIRSGTGWPYSAAGVCRSASTTTGPLATARADTGT